MAEVRTNGRPALRTLRIAVVNDFDLVVHGVTSLLAPMADLEVVDVAVGATDVRPVDVALYDTFGAAHSRFERVRRLVDDGQVGAVAVYTSTWTPAAIDEAIGLGARGYLSKALNAADLADALRRIAGGELVVAGGDGGVRRAAGRWPGEEHGLTEKEADVLALVVRGFENREIADALYISPDTVKSRIRTLYTKIGASSRVEAVLWGVDHGFRPPPSD